MLAIVYIRVSDEDAARHGYSLPEQRETGMARAAALGYQPDQILVIADEGIGGILERPGLTRARELIAAGGVGHLIVMDLDRFSRKLVDQLMVTDEIEHHGTKIEFLTFEWQDTPEGRLFLSIRGAVSEWERAKIRQRTMYGKRRKALQGGIPHFPGQYGYTYDKKTDLISINPNQAGIFRQIVHWLLDEDWSYHRMAATLNDAGIAAPRGKRWYGKTIARMLANPLYKGEFIVNRVETYGMLYNRYRPPSRRVRPKLRPPEEHITIRVPAIIDAETWDRVQAAIARRRREHPGHPKEFYLLSGRMRCGVCGAAMSGYRHKSNNKKRWIRYYCCSRKLSPDKHAQRVHCINSLAPADTIEPLVWAECVACLTDPELLISKLREGAPASTAGEDEAALMESQLVELRTEREKILGLYLKELLDRADVEKRLEDLKNREAFLTRRLAELRPAAAAEPMPEPDDIRALAAVWADRIINATRDEQKRIIRNLVGWCEWRMGKLAIYMHVPQEAIRREVTGDRGHS